MRAGSGRSARAGIALPLALGVIVALSLAAALAGDLAVAAARSARGDLAIERASVAADSVLAAVLSWPVDSSVGNAAPGTLIASVAQTLPDSIGVTVRSLGGGGAWVEVGVARGTAALRVFAGRVGLVRIVADPAMGQGGKFVPADRWWRVPIP